MGTFFRADDKISLEQTDVRISAENGLSFSQNQTIGVYIPPSIKYFSGKDSYIQMDCEIKNDIDEPNGCFATRLMLDGSIGGSALFSSLRVYAGNRETLLEENTEYPSYVKLKYDYSKTDVEQKKRAMTEGAGCWVPNTRGALGTTKSNCNNYVFNPFMDTINGGGNDKNATEEEGTEGSGLSFIKGKLCLPLHCGIFAESSKVFPNLMTNGIYIELVMAPARSLLKQMDSVLRSRRLRLNPLFSGAGTHNAKWTQNGNAQEVFFQNVDGKASVQNFPFVIGEKIGFVEDKSDGSIDGVTTIAGGKDGYGAVINKIEWDDGNGKVKVTIGRGTNVTSTSEMDASTKNWFAYSLSLEDATDWSPSVEVSNVEMIVHKVDASMYESDMKGKIGRGGVINYMIPSVSVRTHSTLASESQSTIPLNIDFSMAKSIMCVPTDSNILPASDNACGKGTYLQVKDSGGSSQIDTQISSVSTGYEGCSNGISSYSFLIDGKQTPSRAISTKKVSDKRGGIDANFMVELEKGLLAGGVVTNSFEEYARNFCISRVLAIGEDAVYDGRGKTARLNCSYEGTTEGQDKPSVNMLWKIFIKHHKRLVIKGDSIMVEN